MAERLSPSTIAQIARAANFPEAEIPVAVAVALAESGGRPSAHCHNCLGVSEDSRGLWQINVNAHADKLTRRGLTPADLFDPLTNATIALEVWRERSGSWRPWSVYLNGSYAAHLDTARAAARSTAGSSQETISAVAYTGAQGGIPVGGLTPVGPTIKKGSEYADDVAEFANAVTAVPEAVANAVNWWRDNWQRVGLGVVGGGLVLVGVALVVADNLNVPLPIKRG